MTTEAIYHKYWSALVGVEAVMVPQDAAIALALRLAIGDAYDAGSALADDLAAIVASQAQPERSPADQRHAEQLQGQISRLNEWLEKYAPALYHNPDIDTAAAVLMEIGVLRRQLSQQIDDHEDLASARRELTTLIAERDGRRQQLAQMDADNAGLIAEIDRLTRQNVIAVGTLNSLSEVHSNGNSAGVDPTLTPAWNRNHPAWKDFSEEQWVTLYRLHSGDLRFRNLSKEDRIDLVGRVLRHLADAGEPVTGPQFDRLKPAWMPTAGAVVLLAQTRKWQHLLALTTEPATA